MEAKESPHLSHLGNALAASSYGGGQSRRWRSSSAAWRTAFNAGGIAVYLPNGVGEVKGIDGPCVAGMALKFIFVLSGGSRCLHLAI